MEIKKALAKGKTIALYRKIYDYVAVKEIQNGNDFIKVKDTSLARRVSTELGITQRMVEDVCRVVRKYDAAKKRDDTLVIRCMDKAISSTSYGTVAKLVNYLDRATEEDMQGFVNDEITINRLVENVLVNKNYHTDNTLQEIKANICDYDRNTISDENDVAKSIVFRFKDALDSCQFDIRRNKVSEFADDSKTELKNCLSEILSFFDNEIFNKVSTTE